MRDRVGSDLPRPNCLYINTVTIAPRRSVVREVNEAHNDSNDFYALIGEPEQRIITVDLAGRHYVPS